MKKFLATAFALVTAANAYAGNAGLQVSGLQVGTEPTGVRFVTGVATNTTNAPIKSAFVQFNLYDAQDNLVGNTIANGVNIAPGDRWVFKADAAQQFDHAKLMSVDTY
jgi:hypothetical protein